MTPVLNAQWGPYAGGAEARQRLLAFVNKSCGSRVGVVWACNGTIYPLRAPMRDGAGIGEVAIFEWSPAPPPPKRAPRGFWQSFMAFWDRYAQMQAESQRIQMEGNRALASSISRGVGRMFNSHRDDAAGVALDILCIALSIALLPTGIGEIGLLGLAGGAILLGADGVAYAKEIGGDEEGAEVWKHQTEGLRIVATVMTLPDLAFGGVKAVRELQEIRELRMLDRSTAAAAQSIGARTATASRAQRYAQIAERANLRAQIRSRQIMAAMELEMVPRAAASASVGLLLREEVSSDETVLHQTMQRLRVHCIGSHR
jgi:hypothetical protein